MRVLENCEPKRVFYYFEEICNIPHGSRNLDAISSYLEQFARDRELSVIRDEYNNIIMYDSDIDDCYRSFEEDLNEESRCDKNNYENFNECDEDIDSQKEDYDEGFKDGYEKGARDAFRAMFKLGFIPRMRISRNRR